MHELSEKFNNHKKMRNLTKTKKVEIIKNKQKPQN